MCGGARAGDLNLARAIPLLLPIVFCHLDHSNAHLKCVVTFSVRINAEVGKIKAYLACNVYKHITFPLPHSTLLRHKVQKIDG